MTERNISDVAENSDERLVSRRRATDGKADSRKGNSALTAGRCWRCGGEPHSQIICDGRVWTITCQECEGTGKASSELKASRERAVNVGDQRPDKLNGGKADE